jgi:hypothetical protein
MNITYTEATKAKKKTPTKLTLHIISMSTTIKSINKLKDIHNQDGIKRKVQFSLNDTVEFKSASHRVIFLNV